MHFLDWAIVVAYLAYVAIDGVRRSHSTERIRGYFLADRSLPWWAVGLSIMATQMSAITLVGTTGQAYAEGMSFIQFYFGLPFRHDPTLFDSRAVFSSSQRLHRL